MAKYTVVKKHHPESSEVFFASTSDVLNYERKETIYPGWIWCTDHRGFQAWVPESYVAIDGDRCRMIRDYLSKELDLEVGHIVELLEMESGWAWILDCRNDVGWMPMECLEPITPDEIFG